jgi:hypothetical protein
MDVCSKRETRAQRKPLGFFGAVVFGLAILFKDPLGNQSGVLSNRALNPVGHFRIRLQERFAVFSALT